MVTGKRPFEAENVHGYIQKHIQEKPQSPSDSNPTIPSYLDKVIMKCLEKDKSKRYQDVEDLLEDLKEQRLTTIPFSTRIKAISFKITSIVVLLAIIVVAILLWHPWSQKKPIPFPSDKPSLAILYFENVSGDESLESWRTGIPDLLITDLMQSRLVKLLPQDRIFSILKKLNLLEVKRYSSEDLIKVANDGAINHTVTGSLMKAGENIIITWRLQKPHTYEIVRSEKVECKGEQDINLKVDELTKQIKSYLNLSQEQIASDIDRETGKITTRSPEAFKHYIEGKKLYNERKFREAIEVLEKAVIIDPEFAMAYDLMATSYDYMENLDQAKKNFLKAMELLDRVSDRERFLIQSAFYYMVENDSDRSINIYRELLKFYPDDETAKRMLGAIYLNLEEWDLALEWFNKVLETYPRSEAAYLNIAYVFMAKGWYDQARNILQANRYIFSNQAYFHRNMSHTYLYQGRYDEALSEVKSAFSLEPDDYRNIALEGNISHIKGDLLQASNVYQQLLEKEDLLSQSEGRMRMAQLYLLQGQHEKCKHEIIQGITHAQKFALKSDEIYFKLFLAYLNIQLNNFSKALDGVTQAKGTALEINSAELQKEALHLLGILYLKMNKMEEVKKVAEQLNKLIGKTGSKKHMRYYHHLMGMIALNNDQIPESLESFEKAVSLLCSQVYLKSDQSLYLDSLASAYYRNGNIEKARNHYEKISSLTWSKLQYGDIYARCFYWLGKIYQEKNLIKDAVEYYEKFLDLWKDADPIHPETACAREQIAKLKEVSLE